MANTAWRNSKALCPYYRRSNARCITCAKTDDEKRELRHKMTTDNDCSKWFGLYCSGTFSKCIYFTILNSTEIE